MLSRLDHCPRGTYKLHKYSARFELKNIFIGFPKETIDLELRVTLTPASIAKF